MKETKHELIIKIIDFNNNDLSIGTILPMDCNLNTALTAIQTVQQQLRERADEYAKARNFGSAKEMPRNFRDTLTIRDVTPVKDQSADKKEVGS